MLTNELVGKAIRLALPTIERLCKEYYWGPKGVVIIVGGKGLEKPIVYSMKSVPNEVDWHPAWGEYRNFRVIALDKLKIALEAGQTSWEVISNNPWKLEKGDILYRGAVAKDTNLAVSTSGSFGEIDETISWIVFDIIAGLCLMEVRDRNNLGLDRL